MSQESAIAGYSIEAGMSRFSVRGTAGGFLSGLGHNPEVAIPDFTGEAQWNPAEPKQASLRLRIRAASLAVQNDISDKDRREMERVMREETLETNRYPEIAFESTGVSASAANRVEIEGNLTLHGATRREWIPAQLAITGDMLRAFGEFTIRQTDYGIQLASVAGGALKLKDELKFNFDIVARKRTV
jgi:polyisoprenoid-binding protein YceI